MSRLFVRVGSTVLLDLPLDVFVVRKLGMPGHEEFAMGAIASGGVSHRRTCKLVPAASRVACPSTVLERPDA
jgi:predicted phosphoribosyltransferase